MNLVMCVKFCFHSYIFSDIYMSGCRDMYDISLRLSQNGKDKDLVVTRSRLRWGVAVVVAVNTKVYWQNLVNTPKKKERKKDKDHSHLSTQ